MFRTFKLSLLGLLLSGCAVVGPNYSVPEIDTPQRFANGGVDALENAPSVPWWEELHDPILNTLLERGAAQNISIQAALSRMREAETGLRQSGLNAQVSGDLSAESQRGQLGDITDTRSNATFNGTYIFDLFGAIRRGQEAADANFDAARYDVGTVRLAYLSDITSAYLNARQFQQAAEITRQNIRSRTLTLSLVQERLASSAATQLELAQARALLRSAEADLPAQITNFEANVFAIATLLAEPALPLLEKLRKGAKQPVPDLATDYGVPADLLRNRPDIRFAERNLAVATASVGISEAALYPQLSLVGFVTLGVPDAWEFGPNLLFPVLNRGFLRASRDAAIEQAKQAELAWRQSVLSAAEEVQEALSRSIHLSRQVSIQRSAVTEARRAVTLSRELYGLNEITLTDVLDAERNALDEQLALSDNVRDFSLAWAQLQVATGKGWQAEILPQDEIAIAAGAQTSRKGP